MNRVFSNVNDGIPLTVIEKAAYQAWYDSQSSAKKNWLEATSYSGEGLALFSSSEGMLESAVFVVKDLSDAFACGGLIRQIPAGAYKLIAEKEAWSAIAFGWAVGSYQFSKYKSDSSELSTLYIEDDLLVSHVSNMVESTFLVRDLVNTPAADMMPEHLASVAESLADKFGASLNQIIGDELLSHNYPTIHAVGRASVHAPQLIDLTWGDENAPKVTLVGKGVCFDSGGLDIKPAAGMRLMKKDMGGAAHVLGLANMIMAANLPVRLRVLIPAVENAIAGNAIRPGDVVKTRSGKTVEIDNTDAEGRLVLCDALDEANNDNPDIVIDFATLTGAMRVALGTELPGFFSSHDDIAMGVTHAGIGISDPVWRMPLFEQYRSLLKSDLADMSNCAPSPFGGAITAALYLKEFVNPDIEWMHFDVMAYNNRALSGRPVGGEAFGIRACFSYLSSRFQ